MQAKCFFGNRRRFGKVWPKLPRKDPGAAAQADGWLIPKSKTGSAPLSGSPSTKLLGYSRRSSTTETLSFSSPTSTLDAGVWSSPSADASALPEAMVELPDGK
jgi:hypothetical protein